MFRIPKNMRDTSCSWNLGVPISFGQPYSKLFHYCHQYCYYQQHNHHQSHRITSFKYYYEIILFFHVVRSCMESGETGSETSFSPCFHGICCKISTVFPQFYHKQGQLFSHRYTKSTYLLIEARKLAKELEEKKKKGNLFPKSQNIKGSGKTLVCSLH